MPIVKKRGGRPTKRPDPDLLNELYMTHTAAEIGAMYGVPAVTVRGWMSRLRKAEAKAEAAAEVEVET